MADSPKVIVKINKRTGAFKSEVVGVQGEACATSLNWVGKLGDGDKENKPDYFQDNSVNNTVEN